MLPKWYIVQQIVKFSSISFSNQDLSLKLLSIPKNKCFTMVFTLQQCSSMVGYSLFPASIILGFIKIWGKKDLHFTQRLCQGHWLRKEGFIQSVNPSGMVSWDFFRIRSLELPTMANAWLFKKESLATLQLVLIPSHLGSALT